MKKRKTPSISARPPVMPVEIPAEPDSIARPEARFPIVGIGASAGGLAAFEAFFSAMPANTKSGMAFVLVQHLAPDHKSILSELVGRYTRMQVFEVEDGMTVRPNCAYIIPPNRDMALLNGTLQLLEPGAPRGLRLPIDFFFRSLAADQHERAIGIVLSGTGSDGALGVRAIKGEGGMVMAQALETTEYDGMPRSAIATGLVDFVLPLAEMPARLMAYVAHSFKKISRPISSSSLPKADDSLQKIFILLRDQTGHDFSGYKPKTISRRIERRMAVHQIKRMDEYASYLQQYPMEIEGLFRDLLIGVTSFFRDPEAFAALETQVIPRLLAGKSSDAAIRIWVPGCSTGEEAYSIAVLLKEQMEALKQNFRIQVFATDIDRRAIELARAAVYLANIAADVPAERLARFFAQKSDGGAYSVNKSLREMLVFSEQDVIRDPPFIKLDLISCRNVLIYMNKELQKKLIPLFYNALNPGGMLFLGTSESVSEFADLFIAIDSKSKLYQRKEYGPRTQWPAIGNRLPPMRADGVTLRPPGKPPSDGKVQLRELTERALLEHYSPVGALVDEHGEILFLHGRTGLYLEPAPGEAGVNILKMAREGLQQALAGALRKASVQKGPVRRPGLRVKTNGEFSPVDLTVRPITTKPDAPAEPALFLVILEEAPATVAPVDSVESADVDARVAVLKKELHAKEEYLQAVNEELETANQELLSSYEKMQPVNEELQSTNEELETSKEEMQSLNEELGTVNNELRQKVTDLSQVNNDMSNLLANTGAGIIFVDRQLNIQLFTPAVTQIINLIPTDVGRPVGDIVSNLADYNRLVADVREVLDSLIPKEVEVLIRSGAWYLLRIRPYRTLENVIEGAVITFTEITEMKKAQATLKESEAQRRLAVVVRDAHDAIMVQDLEGRILAWNQSATRMYGWSEAEALAMNIREMQPESRRAEVRTWARQLTQAKTLKPYRSQRIAKDGGIVDVWLSAAALVDQAGEVYAIATTEREIGSEHQRPPDRKQEGKP
jgi:two-component system CheB/CheR fusion protein